MLWESLLLTEVKGVMPAAEAAQLLTHLRERPPSPCCLFLFPPLVSQHLYQGGKEQWEKDRSAAKPVPTMSLRKVCMDGKGSRQTQDLPGCRELTAMETNARSDSPLCYQLRCPRLGRTYRLWKGSGRNYKQMKCAQDRKESSRNAASAV